MTFSIIPITYLICLSVALTPIALFIIFQIFKFNKTIWLLRSNKQVNHNIYDNYNIANLYINNQTWHIALTKLENNLYSQCINNNTWEAKHYNAIGFILHKLHYYHLAKKYYRKSYHKDSMYIYAKKNIQSLPN